MTITTTTGVRWFMLLIAVIMFVLAGFGVHPGGQDMIPWGLAFFAASFFAG